ncbi:MAG: dethiobiotin synthase [Alphaproteobacteria bacterium]|nr:dethiobiotin synthase [Alphaproteobacteria bacterium]
MKTLFVTATGTGVGKTYVTAGLASALSQQGRSVRILKPIISGFDESKPDDSDTAVLLKSLGLSLTDETLEACSPWRFADPLSPDMAARREGRAIDFDTLVDFCRTAEAGDEDVLLIEGVGGAMVPLDDSHTVLDWIQALGAPALVVAGSYLGTLSHTLTTVATLRERAIDIAAVIVDESEESPVPLEETLATFKRFLAEVETASISRGAEAPAVLAALKTIVGKY